MKRATVVTELPASASRDMDKFVVRLPDGLRAEVEAEARRDERSMNSVVIIALRSTCMVSAESTRSSTL